MFHPRVMLPLQCFLLKAIGFLSKLYHCAFAIWSHWCVSGESKKQIWLSLHTKVRWLVLNESVYGLELLRSWLIEVIARTHHRLWLEVTARHVLFGCRHKVLVPIVAIQRKRLLGDRRRDRVEQLLRVLSHLVHLARLGLACRQRRLVL